MDQKRMIGKVAIQQLQHSSKVGGQLLFWALAFIRKDSAKLPDLPKEMGFGITSCGQAQGTSDRVRSRPHRHSESPKLKLIISSPSNRFKRND
jgi:hypothetical protein